MFVNAELASLSDLSFRTAFVIYLVALVLSLIYYGRMQGVIDMRRVRDAQQEEAENAEAKELVHAGASSSSTGEADADAVDTADSDSDRGLVDEPFDEAEYGKRVAGARKFAGMTQAMVWFGIALHVVSFVTRGFATGRFPLGNMYEYILFMSAVVMIIAAVVAQTKGWHTMWPWVLTPMVILMFFNSTVLYADAAPVVPALQSYWLPIHVSSVSIGASIGIISGIFALLYLLRIWQPKGKEKGFFGALAKPLPSAKKLDSLTYKSAIITLPLLGIGILLGAIWAEAAWGRPWGWDPKETVSLITWILYAAYLHARATAGWKNYKSAWINVLAMLTSIFNLFFINMVVSGLHSYAGLN
ncbi:c-type cytochrome biogenesis protein CcsB [Corynebacterium lubricantis]|uniref:c-type cytochrome biogenesis protein CcsB n=1 Tax=Corynebacterium lubricantis TaxID=541095 RepID=UPI0003747BB8|nr:c-type cytochrome biogenesis protein CcsB [Corynebacterium lubricantis]